MIRNNYIKISTPRDFRMGGACWGGASPSSTHPVVVGALLNPGAAWAEGCGESDC